MTQEKKYTDTASGWRDITLPLNNDLTMLPPGLSAGPVKRPTFDRFFDVEKGDKVTMSRIEMNSHDGTHIDAPLHFIYGGNTIDNMPLDTTVGPARVIEIKDRVSIKVTELEPYNIQPGERIVFKTKNSPKAYEKKDDPGRYIYIDTGAARYLADRNVRMVGMDYITIGNNDDPKNLKDTHDILLGNGVYIIEGLDLTGVEAGDYELVCLPLRLHKGDAAPCRAMLRPL